MQFRQGMLGVAVLAVAIAGALIGAWVMSMDVEEREVINYSPLTDITGLFDTEMAPQFTDYSPSTNYTGYWTTASVEGETRYFDGVDFTQASRANNYRVNLPPVESTQGTVNLPDESPSDILRQVWLHTYRGGNLVYNYSDTAEAIALTDVIGLVTEQTSGTFRIASNDGPNVTGVTSSDLNLDWLIIANKADFRSNGNYDCMTMEYKDNAPTGGSSYHLISLSCEANLDKKIVTMYYDNNFTQRMADISLDQCYVIYAGDDMIGGHELTLGTDGDYKFELFPANTYMDITKGVEME